MTTSIVTPETLTFDHIKSWSGAEMRKQMALPEMREAITNIVKNKSLEEVLAAQEEQKAQQAASSAEKTAEELAAEEEQKKVAEEAQKAAAEAEAQRVGAEQEAARVAAEPKKFVIDYQVTDEDGNPLGRPTHLEATSQEELLGKMKEAHIQATRAFHRLKKQKVSFKEQQVQPVPAQASDAELLSYMKDLKSDDPQKQLDAVRKVQKVETDKIKVEADQELAKVNELRRQEQVSYQFLNRHRNDFNNCQANIELVKGYFEENQLAWTLDNLEIAFHALESELAPVVGPAAPVAPANPAPPAAPVVTAPAAPVVVQPPVPAPALVSPPANPVAATPRPGVNGGIQPGSLSATRPAVTTSKGLTVEEIKSWDGPTMRAKMRNPAIRAQIEAFAASRPALTGKK